MIFAWHTPSRKCCIVLFSLVGDQLSCSCSHLLKVFQSLLPNTVVLGFFPHARTRTHTHTHIFLALSCFIPFICVPLPVSLLPSRSQTHFLYESSNATNKDFLCSSFRNFSCCSSVWSKLRQKKVRLKKRADFRAVCVCVCTWLN